MAGGLAALRPLRPALTAWHRWWAASPARARRYGALLAACRGAIPARLSDTLLSNMHAVRWPDVDLPAVAVRVGPAGAIRLHPHFGEFDMQALVRRDLTYEADVFAWLARRAHHYDAIVEIGANVGVFTLWFAATFRRPDGAPAAVIAFEPSPLAAARLRANLAANGLSHVAVHEAAVSETSGVVEFHEPEGHLTNGSLARAFAEQFSDRVTVRQVSARSGDEVAALVPAGRVLVKIDVEGAEPLVLRGLAGFIASRRPDLLIEVLPDHDAAIRAALPDDYRAFEITASGAVERPRVEAAAGRDWWLEPRA